MIQVMIENNKKQNQIKSEKFTQAWRYFDLNGTDSPTDSTEANIMSS